jgi:hypothetical protein
MKQCTKCLEIKPTSSFHKKATCRDGLFQWCISCHRLITKTRQKELRSNPEFVKKEAKKVAVWRNKNPEKAKLSWKKYLDNNRAKIYAIGTKYRLSKMRRTPIWLTETEHWMIEQAYELAVLRTKITGFSWHVDHIIPLQGRLVSGLHTPYNLQVIPGKDNQQKSNYFALT